MNELFQNQVLFTSLAAMLLAQLLKVFTGSAKPNWSRLTDDGGMPSSHSALVASLATGCAIVGGMGSLAFAIAVVVSLIVMHDAAHIRRQAGKHAEIINDLRERLRHIFDAGLTPEDLKTLLGHTYLEMFAGVLLGIGLTLFSFWIF